MTLARLLTAALFLCCLPALSQDQQSQRSRSSASPCRENWAGCPVVGNVPADASFFFFDWSDYKAATASEPWRIIPSQPASLDSVQNALDPVRLDRHRLDQVNGDPNLRNLKLETLGEDTTCYAIRSYVVARDSKDSDSTHPAGYSTCQPSNRYQVKSADLRVVSGDR